jgi:predicted house-cleaning noncanonical NTP pyrophosphatase (MazG superfamily)
MTNATKKQVWNKLVQDEIVRGLERKGIRCEFHQLPDEQMLTALDDKVQEEFQEYMKAGESDKL